MKMQAKTIAILVTQRMAQIKKPGVKQIRPFLSNLISSVFLAVSIFDRQFITASSKNTTQTCHDCGFVMGSTGTKKLTLADREWICPQCHVHHIRDYNAALNILEKGLQKQQKA